MFFDKRNVSLIIIAENDPFVKMPLTSKTVFFIIITNKKVLLSVPILQRAR